jgi:Putative adhesin
MKALRLTWIAVGGAATVALLVAGTVGGRIWLSGSDEPAQQTVRYSRIRAVTKVVVEINSGHVLVRAGGNGRVDFERRPRDGRILDLKEIWEGDRLRLAGSCRDGNGKRVTRCQSEYVLQVPAATEVEARADSGDVTVAGLTGAVSLTSGSGDLELRDASGRVRVTTNSGEVTATALRSSTVEAQTNTGDVMLAFAAAPGQAAVTTNTGDIELAVPPGQYRTSADTISGRREVTVPGGTASSSVLRVRSNSGDVRLRVG